MRSMLFVSVTNKYLTKVCEFRYSHSMDRIEAFNDNLSCREVKMDKIVSGDLPYSALKCDRFL